MKPYFFPYIGYFQLIASVDRFVVYDNIKYTKKGWINRNRMLQNGSDTIFSLPLKSGSDSLDIGERELAPDFNRKKLLNQLTGAYKQALYFDQTYSLIEQIVQFEDVNLFRYLHNSIVRICDHLYIDADIIISSNIAIDHSLKGQEKVLALCAATDAASYVNTIGGTELYSKEAFRERNIELKFIRSKLVEYRQYGNEFVPWLSIIDVMMFNPIDRVLEYITTNFELI